MDDLNQDSSPTPSKSYILLTCMLSPASGWWYHAPAGTGSLCPCAASGVCGLEL